jgi:hypothetical protein
MSKRKNSNWEVDLENIYVFGREERVQSAYEATVPNEKFKIKEDIKDASDQSGALCSRFQRKTGTGEND